jgi:hypothetical protein
MIVIVCTKQVQAWTNLEGYKSLRLSGFLNDQHMRWQVISAICTGHFYTPGDILVTQARFIEWPEC